MEDVTNTLAWWYEKCTMFPQLLRMALNYLSILGECEFVYNPINSANFELSLVMLIDIEQIFSHGQLLFSHTHSHLSTQTMCAVLCISQ